MFRRLLQTNLGFLARSLRGSEWRHLLDYVTPSFLEVMPVGHLVGQARELLALSADQTRFRARRRSLAEELALAGLHLELSEAGLDGLGYDLARWTEARRRELGEEALALYFFQLTSEGETLLDLRASRFALSRETPDEGEAGNSDAGRFRWAPRPLYVAWDPAFRDSVWNLYSGFYLGDSDRFDGALAALHLEPAREVFLSHFGTGDQRSVRFRTKVFHSTFHEAFVRCRDSGKPLHRNFLALGVYLACLYDLLEVLDLEFDVRAAFERAAKAGDRRPGLTSA